MFAKYIKPHCNWLCRYSYQSLRLATEPKPVPPVISAGAVSKKPGVPLALHVVAPNGQAIAAVDLRVGFDAGEPEEGYTQDYGWTLNERETRTPRWVEFEVPIYQLRSPRFPIDMTKGNVLNFVLTPNDMGVYDFTGMQIDIAPGKLLLHRNDAILTFEVSHDGN